MALPWHAAYSASKYGLARVVGGAAVRPRQARNRGFSRRTRCGEDASWCRAVEIAGVDREHPQVRKWVDRFSGHAIAPEAVADKILRGVTRNRYLIYTSTDIRALYAFKRFAWWPYSVAMRQVNVIFTRALRPSRSR